MSGSHPCISAAAFSVLTGMLITSCSAKGKMKEAAGAMTGAITGDEAKKEEGRAQQRAAAAAEEAGQKERTRQEQAKAEEAERERDRQERKGKGGLLGNL